MMTEQERTEEIRREFGFGTLQDLYDFTEYLSGAKIKVRVSYFEDDGDTHKDFKVLYTDGDSGTAVFSFSEIYEEKGMQIKMGGCSYCDISLSSLLNIYDIFERNAQDIEDLEVIRFEHPA